MRKRGNHSRLVDADAQEGRRKTEKFIITYFLMNWVNIKKEEEKRETEPKQTELNRTELKGNRSDRRAINAN